MAAEDVVCSECQHTLDPKSITPCPNRGGTARTIAVGLTVVQAAGVVALELRGFAAGLSKTKGKFVELFTGIARSKHFQLVRKTRLIDKRNDHYLERVETLDGTLIHHRDERLSDHRGHGSAKNAAGQETQGTRGATRMHQFPTPLDWWRTARVRQGCTGSNVDRRPTRADDGKEQKAYHEAAHAAFAWHFGHSLQHVKIGDAKGASNAGFDKLINPTAEQCQQRALICLAGEAAWATVSGMVEATVIVNGKASQVMLRNRPPRRRRHELLVPSRCCKLCRNR